ncbi:hypothetical protein RIF29_20471 [Crotalaria pallida]|uniref:Uncharacterized protein n=1 Tax=Crotalaria pallida TaxID=3830 RepID=A0AAN9F1M6_CROPI
MIEQNLKSLSCQQCCSDSKQENDIMLEPVKDLSLSIIVDDSLKVDYKDKMVQAKVDSIMVLNLCNLEMDSSYLAHVHYEEEEGGAGVPSENIVQILGQNFRPKMMKTLVFLQGPGVDARSSQGGANHGSCFQPSVGFAGGLINMWDESSFHLVSTFSEKRKLWDDLSHLKMVHEGVGLPGGHQAGLGADALGAAAPALGADAADGLGAAGLGADGLGAACLGVDGLDAASLGAGGLGAVGLGAGATLGALKGAAGSAATTSVVAV